MEITTKMIEDVWKGVFNETPQVEIDGEDISVNQYAISPTTVKVTRKSIVETKTENVDGWELMVFIDVPATYLDPPDVDEIFLGEHQRIQNVIQLMVSTEATHRANQVMDEQMMYDYYVENS